MGEKCINKKNYKIWGLRVGSIYLRGDYSILSYVNLQKCFSLSYGGFPL